MITRHIEGLLLGTAVVVRVSRRAYETDDSVERADYSRRKMEPGPGSGGTGMQRWKERKKHIGAIVEVIVDNGRGVLHEVKLIHLLFVSAFAILRMARRVFLLGTISGWMFWIQLCGGTTSDFRGGTRSDQEIRLTMLHETEYSGKRRCRGAGNQVLWFVRTATA